MSEQPDGPLDLACNISIINGGSTGMGLVTKDTVAGFWAPPPAKIIDPEQGTTFSLRGTPLVQGPNGSVTYFFTYIGDGEARTATVEFLFANPYTSGPNVVDWRWIPDGHPPGLDGTITFVAHSNGYPELQNAVEPGGSPVYATYTLTWKAQNERPGT